MTHLEEPDATRSGAQLPRTAIRTLGNALMLGHIHARLLLLKMGNAARAEVSDISQVELMQRIEANPAHLILDVRSPGEYRDGHIPGAINIPHNRLEHRLAEIGAHMNNDVVLYCGNGVRVAIAANILHAAGFSRLLHLDGDMDGWLSNGSLPVAY